MSVSPYNDTTFVGAGSLICQLSSRSVLVYGI